MQENHNHTRQRSSSSSYYSSSPSEDYISDMEYEYDPPLPGSDDPPLYPIRVNRTVAITVEVSPRSSISMETDPSRIRTYCYSSSPSMLDWEERRHTGGGRTVAVRAPVSAVGSPSSKSHYAYETPRNDPTARYVASADDASTKTATVVLPPYSDYYRSPGIYAQHTPRISGGDIISPPEPIFPNPRYEDFELYPPPSPPPRSIAGQGHKRSHSGTAPDATKRR
ncbi:hypothetical protein K440DRAFT_613189 [Wilcoxina mikolae CBS 423.85]|nr:hypothetical protein K440DRAFT_613189 [Wilcoxina mikolae CBS 423.85]